MENLIIVSLLILLLATTLLILRMRRLIVTAMLFGIFSLLMASLFVILDAVDVAFTEAAVGAGISTILMLATLAICGSRIEYVPVRSYPAAFAAVIVGLILIFGLLDMPRFGDTSQPAFQHVYPRYVEESASEIDIPNVVTSVLASYRGYDTLGEVTVIFTAGLGVVFLLTPAAASARRRRIARSGDDGAKDSGRSQV